VNAVTEYRNNDLAHGKVHIKGIREGLLITTEDGSWVEVRAALLEHLKQQADFLQGGQLILDTGDQVLRTEDIGQLRDSISENGLTLWAILSRSSITEHNAQNLGLVTSITRSRVEPLIRSTLTYTSELNPTETMLSGEQAVLVKRTLRPGYCLKHSGHIIIIGDVNPGAEIIAGGDILVWGHLRGIAHAGADGNENAVVCALDLSPTQLFISGQTAEIPKQRGKVQPKIARLLDGQVVAEAWNKKFRNSGINANLPLIPLVRKRRGKS